MVKDGSKEALPMAENSPPAPKGSEGKVVVEDQVQAKATKDGIGTDSLLDVFTSEELVENPISKLSKDLNDVSIDSLLEQTKQVAEEIKGGH
jgi:hypothetical protein